MTDNIFSIHSYIDTSTWQFDLKVGSDQPVWKMLDALHDYIISQFESGALVSNYQERKYVYVGEGTVIGENVTIVGPAIIGKNCRLAPGSYVRENCLIGDNVKIGHGSEIKNSIFFPGSSAAHLNYVSDSIVGNQVNISAGAVVANMRLDNETIKVKFNEEITDTGLKKFGAIIGDDSMIGANSVINPGTILAKKSVVYPLTSVRGVHSEGNIIK